MSMFAEHGDKKFVCDGCKAVFQGKEIVLKTAPTNFDILTPLGAFIFIDKDGKIMGGRKFPNGSIGDQMLHCPKCNRVHMYGFDLYKEKEETKKCV